MPTRSFIIAFLCLMMSLLAVNGSIFGQGSTSSQSGILFNHLTTAQGLSDNYIYDMCIDGSGNLWICTGDGLNMFNGKTVTKYLKQDYPQMENNFPRQIECDDNNRIWVLFYGGSLVMIDENRKFHRVSLQDPKRLLVRTIMKTKSRGIIFLAGNDFYSAAIAAKTPEVDSFQLKYFKKIPIKNFDTAYAYWGMPAIPIGDDQVILNGIRRYTKIDFQAGVASPDYWYLNQTILGNWGPNELLMYDKDKIKVYAINLETRAFSYPFDSLRDQHGRPFSGRCNRMLKQDNKIWITTADRGLYRYDLQTGKLHLFRHTAADPTSISNNSASVITMEKSGWIFIANTPNGISYFNSNAVVGQQAVFTDNKGTGYDGNINGIATLDNDHYFIAVQDNVMRWQRSTNTTEFLATENNDKADWLQYPISEITFDSKGRLWVAAVAKGLYVLDHQYRVIKLFVPDTLSDQSLPNFNIRHMEMDPAGQFMWIVSRKGVVKVDVNTFRVDHLQNLPFWSLRNLACTRIWFENADNVWIGTETKGAWHFQFSTAKLVKYDKENGAISNYILTLNKDRNNNIYLGTGDGLQIRLTNGKNLNITTNEGLMNNRVEALMLDKRNRMWMGNDVGLSCFNIADTSLRVFDERYGLSVHGYRINSYYQSEDDEMFWGTERGLQYYYPDNLWSQEIRLNTTINRVESRDIVANITQPSSFNLSATDNSVSFYFAAIDYSKHLRTFYEYKLEAIDKDWVKATDQNFVRYSSLPAGKYIFKVRASNDNKVWVNASNEVVITIARPLFQKTWFRLMGTGIGLLLIWLVIRYYRRKQDQQREALETEAVINYFASRINTHLDTEKILWDVAKNCISRLNFEDCVIYLLDEERQMLVQKAAFGPKLERDFTIYQPIEIPVGKGIVGTVAKTGKAELVTNTESDNRYIADDARRSSELAVPLIVDNKVIGVLDSEHSKRNFFTNKHLSILSTIAVLCANQIQRARAEQEKQKARIEVLENKQKVTESRLQSLRLQMNPHFLFNALNSIQQMILGNEEMVATRYLSRFSKLLRTVLVHSDRELISLKEELEILKLYVELESVRFKDSFKYQIECDENIDTEEVKVPTLLVQPFVENAIWHGLMHKEGDRHLSVRFFEKNDSLHCIVDDNGIGRKRSQESKLTRDPGQKHTSKGIQVSLERLKAMQNGNGHAGSLSIIDLENEKGEAIGTRVEIDFAIQTS